MNSIQKWLIVIAIWVAAIGILLSGLRGRYEITYNGGAFMKKDSWTGKVYGLGTATKGWKILE